MNQEFRYICIHGHFYQPPRENPWLEQIEIQESAHPFHDWNERIAEECYTPNTQARILQDGRLKEVLNNYEFISFDFGPTLLSWLENHAPETYQAILEADAAAIKSRSGHGNAIAHAYNHVIMPLASSRDKLTQILWGIEDFKKRFRRHPEGMWLPETAVDKESLEIMVDNGIRFTVLSPWQARRFRNSSASDWEYPNPSAIDPSRPYLCNLSADKSIAIFFYDGPISQSIAFERLLDSGETFFNRLMSAFSPHREWPQIIHIATDGESYGHHHRFGEMALAYAIKRFRNEPSVKLTNYGEYLEKNPPTAEVEFMENTAWSCAHGVGRWSEDCGCCTAPRPDWNQKWRAPLRKSLNLLRDRVDRLFEDKSRDLFKNPWDARNEYIRVLLAGRQRVGQFLKRHAVRRITKSSREQMLRLLEMQRNRMLMFTSCGWFFDDITGIETLQILRYAARVIQLAQTFDAKNFDDFVSELSVAQSNVKPNLSGDEIFKQKIEPQTADLDRVAAHVAISSIFEEIPFHEHFYCYDLKLLDSVRGFSGDRLVVVGQISVLSRITTESRNFVFAVVYFGGVDLRCSISDLLDKTKYEGLKKDLPATFSMAGSTEIVRRLDKYFPGNYFSIQDLFVDERRKIADLVTRKMYEEQARILELFYSRNKDVATLLIMNEAKVPDTFLACARFVLNRTLLAELDRLTSGVFPDNLESVLEEAKFWKMQPDLRSAEKLIQNRIFKLVCELHANPRDENIQKEIVTFLDLSKNLDLHPDLSESQIRFFRAASSSEAYPGTPLFRQLAERLAVILT